jgi:hypothetical protein
MNLHMQQRRIEVWSTLHVGHQPIQHRLHITRIRFAPRPQLLGAHHRSRASDQIARVLSDLGFRVWRITGDNSLVQKIAVRWTINASVMSRRRLQSEAPSQMLMVESVYHQTNDHWTNAAEWCESSYGAIGSSGF